MKKIFLEHVNCDLCGCDKYKIRYRKPDIWYWTNQFEFPVVECVNCGLVYVNPRPTQESMRSYYPEIYIKEASEGLHKKRYPKEMSFLPELTNEKVLDIGCCEGDFLIHLKDKYPDISACGVDFFSNGVKSEKVKFYKKLLTECEFEDNFFDIITSWAVFEHLHNPNDYFREVSRILKKDGKFIFLVPNSDSLYGKYAYNEDLPRHLYHFSQKILIKYAEKNNFKLTKCIYTDEIFDGRGLGTFKNLFSALSAVKWENIYFKKLNFLQKAMRLCGIIIDNFVFAFHWEAKLGISGTMVVEFKKND